MKFRVGVDVGGTFTDFLVSGQGTAARVYKSSTTPDNPAVGFFAGLEEAARDYDLSLQEFLDRVETIVHGTTITTNAVLTGTGARTGFLTTAGFRDVLNMRRGMKERQFEKYSPPAPLVPRHLTHVARERVNVEGQVLTPLEEADVVAAAAAFREAGVEAVAVSYLWSFRNPAHEQRTREILERELPGIYVSVSTEILPQIRVYERHSTTALNAYSGPILTRYLSRLERELESRGYKGTLLIMQSNGGVMSPQVAQRFASNTLLSGPAGAPGAGVFYGSTHGFRNVITIDMGGTSFDVALVARRSARHHDRRLDRRPPDRIADPRYPHDRCGRRLDRAGRVRGPACGRAPRARARNRVPRATAAAARSRPSPTPISCWAISIPMRSTVASSSSTVTPRSGRSSSTSPSRSVST